jgi:ketosteroid isomerase-like protein
MADYQPDPQGAPAAQTEATRTVVCEFVSAWTTGDIARLTALLAEDIVWATPASMGPPRSGRSAVAALLAGGTAGQAVRIETLKRDVHHLLVDGHHAIALVRLTAVAHSGAEYGNEYAWHYEVVGGLVHRITEYTDTLAAARLGFLPFTDDGAAPGHAGTRGS